MAITMNRESSETFDRLFTHIEIKFASLEKRLLENKIEKREKSTFLEEFGNSVSSVIGINEITTHKNICLKILWTIFLMAGSGATIYFVYKTASEYYDSPTGTKVQMDGIDYEYPPVLLCHDMLFDEEKARKLNLSMNALEYSIGYVNILYRPFSKSNPEFDQHKGRDEFFNFYKSKGYTSLSEYFENMTTSISQDIEFSNFMTNFNSSYYCTHCNQPAQPKLREYNFCYSFSLASPNDDELYIPPQISIKLNTPIKTNSIWTLRFGSTEPIFLKSGYFYFAMIKVERVVTLYKVSTPCTTNDTENETKPKTENDFELTCKNPCQDKAIQKAIKCHLAWYASEENYQPNKTCNNFEPLPFYNGTLNDFYTASQTRSSTVAPMAKRCMKKCPKKCEQTFFSLTLNNELRVQDLYATVDLENYAHVSIQLRDTAVSDGGIFTTIEYTRISPIDLISNIGGMLGLFVGATLMTFVQLIFFFARYCVKKCTTGTLKQSTYIISR